MSCRTPEIRSRSAQVRGRGTSPGRGVDGLRDGRGIQSRIAERHGRPARHASRASCPLFSDILRARPRPRPVWSATCSAVDSGRRPHRVRQRRRRTGQEASSVHPWPATTSGGAAMSRWTARKSRDAAARVRPGRCGHVVPPIEWCPPAAAEGALTHADWARLGWRLFDPPSWLHRPTRARS